MGEVDVVVDVRGTFSPDELSVARARRFVREALDGRVGVGVQAAVVFAATELATNASRHARTPFAVVVQIGPAGVRIEVADGVAMLPTPRLVVDDGEAITARGLHIVAELARSWGAMPTADGKSVWAEFDV